jgi:hypothetical protein
LKIFSFATGVNDSNTATTPMVHPELGISPRIVEKFETDLMGYSGAWGNLFQEKNLKSCAIIPLS